MMTDTGIMAGNIEYRAPGDLPDEIPVFPLAGALLLPGGNLPLNIFEPRYLAMTDDALAGDRIIGMIQPDLSGAEAPNGPALCDIGCIGRLTGFQETGDGRYLINLTGICRFRMIGESEERRGYRRARIAVDDAEFGGSKDQAEIDREQLLETFRQYLDANNLEADWESVEQTDDETLVTALCMMSPYGPAEKQAMLEAEDLKTRADTLIAITQIALAREANGSDQVLQ